MCFDKGSRLGGYTPSGFKPAVPSRLLAAAGLRRGVLSSSSGDGWTAHNEAI